MSRPAGGEADAIAADVLASLSSGRQIAAFSQRLPDFDLDKAYAVTAALRRLRVARGEVPVGRKIGFTNRTIWSQFGVFAPIWGDMYATTVRDIGPSPGTFSLAGLMEPRIEPEIVFRLAAAPSPDMDETALLGVIEWIGFGFEIVQTLFPGWRFAPADCIAGGGLHGALLLGSRRRVDAADTGAWLRRLRSFEVELFRGEELVDRGHASNVLDGPLSALRHLIGLLAADSHNPPLAAGEIITTGTVTGAPFVAPGERWRARMEGMPLEDLVVAFD